MKVFDFMVVVMSNEVRHLKSGKQLQIIFKSIDWRVMGSLLAGGRWRKRKQLISNTPQV